MDNFMIKKIYFDEEIPEFYGIVCNNYVKRHCYVAPLFLNIIFRYTYGFIAFIMYRLKSPEMIELHFKGWLKNE